MTELRVAALYRYPLKSAAGVACDSVELDRFGVRGDRRWMMVDDEGAPITQREEPSLAHLSAAAKPDGSLRLNWRGASPAPADAAAIDVTCPPAGAPRISVAIWGDTVDVALADARSSAWLGARIGSPARLAYMPDDVERPVNPRYADPEHRTSLTDGYPLHVIGTGSLDDLNARLEQPVGVDRFRPNIFVEGCEPFDEDDWIDVRVGECEMKIVKPCPRCTVTTVDPATGVRGREPLATLANYRRRPGGVMFGQNALHQGRGTLRVGDPVEVLSRRSSR